MFSHQIRQYLPNKVSFLGAMHHFSVIFFSVPFIHRNNIIEIRVPKLTISAPSLTDPSVPIVCQYVIYTIQI